MASKITEQQVEHVAELSLSSLRMNLVSLPLN